MTADEPKPMETAETSANLGDKMDLTPHKDGGVIKVITKEGVGDLRPTTGDTVYVHYVGTLEDGTKFDSSRDRGEQFSFTLGQGKVIKGWDLGVATMRQGEICTLTCQHQYAYGEAGSPPKIPPKATLIFEVELFSWEGEDISPDKDRSLTKSIQHPGEKYEHPNEGATIEAHIVGRQGGNTFLDREVKFVLGECIEAGLPEGIDKAIRKFKTHEKATVHMKSKWGYGAAGNAELNIPPNADLDFDVELKHFQKVKESWEMNEEEKLSESEALKAKGTEHFQAGKYKLAIAKYKKIVSILQYETTLKDSNKEKRDQLYLAAELNLALCFLKLGETVESIKHCDNALKEHKGNVKALYRRGQAYQQQNDYEAALKDYAAVLEVEADNKAAKLGIQQCKQKIKEQDQKDKTLYSNMFKKTSAP